jgi:hypothetical protein
MQNNFRPSPNSFKNTFCVFQETSLDAIQNLKLQYDSKSGSKYYYTKEGMYRLSNHWGRLANCKWRLEAFEQETDSKFKLGFAAWDCFYPDNDSDLLYYLEVDYDKKLVQYQHKNNPNFNKKAVLRTTFETRKRIKQVRNILQLSSWANYFESDIDDLRKYITEQLIFSEKTLDEIKKECK